MEKVVLVLFIHVSYSLIRSFEWHYIFDCYQMEWMELKSWTDIVNVWRCICVFVGYKRNRWFQALFGLVGTRNNWQTVGFDRCYRAVENKHFFDQRFDFCVLSFDSRGHDMQLALYSIGAPKELTLRYWNGIACNDYFIRFPRYYANITELWVLCICAFLPFLFGFFEFFFRRILRCNWSLNKSGISIECT